MKNGTYNLLRLWGICCLGFLFAFSTVLKAVHVGSGTHNFGTTSQPNVVSYSLDVIARVYVENGYVMVEYTNKSTWNGTAAGQWPGAQWCYATARATVNGTTINAVKFDFAYSTSNRIFNAGKVVGKYVIMLDGKGAKEQIGTGFVLCTFNFVNGEITDLEYTESSIFPPWRHIVNGSEDNVLLICPYYSTPDGETHVRPIALLPDQSFELTPDFWKNQGVDVSELPEGTIFGYPIFEGSLDDWLNSKDNLSNTLKDMFAGNDYHGWDLLIGGHDDDTGKVWTGTEANCPSGLKDLRPINPSWWNKGKNEPNNDFKDNGDGTYVRNPEGSLATVDEVFDMYENLLGRPLTNDEKDKILPGWNGSGGGNTGGDGDGDDDNGSTGEKTDLSKVEGSLDKAVGELKGINDKLGKGIDVNVDIDVSGVEGRLDTANDHLKEMKENEKDFFDKVWDSATDKNGEGEGKATGLADKAFGKADGWSNNFKNTFGGWLGLISVPALPELDSNVSFIVDIGKKKVEINPFKYNTFAIVGSWLRHFVLWVMYTIMIYGWMKHAVKMIALAFITPTLTTNGVSIFGNEFTTAKGLIYAAILVGLLFGVINAIIGVMAGYAVVAIPNAIPAIIWNAMRMFDAAIPVIDLILYFPRYVVGYQSITMAVFGYKFIKSLLA